MQVEVLEFNDFKFKLDTDFRQALLDKLIHRQGEHLSCTALSDDDFRFQWLAWAVARFSHEGFGSL